jgi:hypothetical protein
MLLSQAPAQAQATRTWVSGVGDDANPCSRTAPCKTFAGAIAKTAPGGEIDALDPGGFGALTITKSITIDGGGGQVASVLVAGTNGIVVAAQPGDVVILRNMRLNGLLGGGNSNAGLSGIRLLSAALLSIENCVIFGFSNFGIDAANSGNSVLNVTNTNITNVASGINLSPAGTLNGQADHVTIQKASANGITSAGGNVAFTITNSNIVNAANTGVNAGASANVVLDIDSSVVANNNTGFATAGALIRISRKQIYDNNVNYAVTGGSIATSGDNYVAVNGPTPTFGSITRN